MSLKLINSFEKNGAGEDLLKLAIDIDNQQKSIESRCKVCQHPKRLEIEKLRVQGHTYKYIKESLELDFSIMSIQRHMAQHYKKNLYYYQQLIKDNKEELEKVLNDNQELRYLLKPENREDLEIFLDIKGYCKTENKLCDLIKPRECKSNKEVLEELSKDYTNMSNYFSYSTATQKENILRDLLNDKIDCLICNNIL